MRNIQRWRLLARTGFFLLFLLSPIFNLFRLDLNLGHFILFGWNWTLGLEDFQAGRASPLQALGNIILRGFLPIALMVGTGVWVSWKYGRLYCGWLCPHFSIVETINAWMRRASGKFSLWDKKPLPLRHPDGWPVTTNSAWWPPTIALALACAFTWAVVLLTYLLPPWEIYGNLWHLTLTRNQAIFIGAATTFFFTDFTLARHLFCRYGCAVGYFQGLAWILNRRALVVGFDRDRAVDCASCYSACDHVCPMRLTPRNVKRLMFTCTQCGQCLDACATTQADNPRGPLLSWVQGADALAEAAFNSHDAMALQKQGVKPLVFYPPKRKGT